jgi:hypothetical protein
MSWRFYPLKDSPDYGLLAYSGENAVAAEFLTVEQARDRARQVRAANALQQGKAA